ncbi:protein PIF-like [Mercenaria mercenaria]|uniref:protein PIF-like n=1 Tax=Mercenaria mercenaria TaxID=6596 RepID=UPI00234F808B|nr:protein PIF-like [Mercenaria mercenaria]
MICRAFGVLLYFAAVAIALDRDCDVKADLFFVIDGSDSLSDADFAASKAFIIQVLRAFAVEKDRIHVGANVFGTDVYDRIELMGPTLDFKMKYRLFEKRIETLQRTRSGTATFKAIQEMRKEFADRGRDDVTKVGIVITDGKSVNINATAQQARAARDEGINMIAIGVGDNIFRPELYNIASSPTSVYETDQIMGVVKTIQDAVKEYICIVITTTISTEAPTTPESDSLKDPCLTDGVVSYDVEDLCSGYVMCVNKRSMRACCQTNHAYVAGTGCVLDPTCMDTCDGDDNHLIHPLECDSIPFPGDDRYYIQYEGEGHTNKTRPCAPGTVFNVDSCMCDKHDTRPQTGKLDDCNPTANFTFENGFEDSAGHAYAGTEFVDVIDGHAQFNGNGMVNIYRFSMDTFGKKLVLRIRFLPAASGQSNEALLTNCISSKGESSSISIRVVRSSVVTMVVFSTDTTLDTQQVTIPLRNPNIWNEATYIYDGSMLYGIIDDGTDPVLVQSAPLSGDILLRKSGMILGAGSQLNSYTGDIDEFQLYKCFPAYAQGYRA